MSDKQEKTPRLFEIQLIAASQMDEGKIAGGTAGLIKPWHDGRHLYDTELFVHTKYQGQGLAKKLMSELISTAVEKYGNELVREDRYQTDRMGTYCGRSG